MLFRSQIAPRINAASRMAHAMLAHTLLMERDPVKARMLALELDAYNVDRQKISQEIALRVKKLAEEKFTDKKFIFAVDEAYPFGIVGLIAGRIAREFNKPVCILTRGEETSQGSFRSIPELNIIETIEECRDLIVKFGGHAQAAGMTIRNDKLDEFYERFNALVEKKLQGVITEPELQIDMRLDPEYITPSLCRDIALLAPFGEGNREPVFSLEGVVVKEARFVGTSHKHLKLALSVPGSQKVFDAIGFSFGQAFAHLLPGAVLDVAFELGENTWNGTTSVQLRIVDIREK